MIAMGAPSCVLNSPSIAAILIGWYLVTVSPFIAPVGNSENSEKISPAMTPTRTHTRPSSSNRRDSR